MIKLVVNTRESATRPTLITAVLFNEISLNFKFDSIASTYKLQMFFNPDDAEQAELAAVSHIHECQIFYVHDTAGSYATREVNGKAVFEQTTDELIMTGFMLSQVFSDSAAPSLMEIGGYSKTGVLGDCDFPTSAYPLETTGLSLRQLINTKVLPYFSNPKNGGFNFRVKSSRADSTFEQASSAGSLSSMVQDLDDEADADIGKSTQAESKNILSSLKEIAVQKNLVLSTDIFGNLVVNVPYLGNEYLFEIGTDKGIPFVDVNMGYNGQGLHSQIEAVGQADKNEGNMPYAIVYNPLVPVVFRPKVISVSKATDNTIAEAARSELGNELKSVPMKIILEKPVVKSTAGYGKFIMPNNTVLVKNRNCALYTASKWFIEEVNYTKTAEKETTEITCVLPGVYGGTVVNPFIDPGQNIPRL